MTFPPSITGSNRFKVKYGYTGGYLTSVQDYTGDVNGPVLWNLNLLDAQGNAISETYGNGLWLQNSFDPATGEPLTRQSGTGGQASNVQNLSYVWDDAGNLSSRQDLRQSLTESFSYDALDRLTRASGPAAQSTTIGYDAIGNITSKSGVGSYTYNATKKHAVANAGGAAYLYDANGNLTSRSGATVSWTSYNLPSSISDPSGYNAQFVYAPDRSRLKQISTYAGGTETTIYVGGLFEKLTTATRTHWKHLIPTPSGQVQVIRRSDGTTDTFYVTTDHLGSTDAVLNAAGTVLMRGSFTVHGARRASNWQGAPSSTEWQSIANTTRLGYTGHEQIDNILLVHMNGRVFDPTIGRFLSADPYIDGPETTQGWNRYAYVHGRLMSATDPSGFEEVPVAAVWTAKRIYPWEDAATGGSIWVQSGSGGSLHRGGDLRGGSTLGSGGSMLIPPPPPADETVVPVVSEVTAARLPAESYQTPAVDVIGALAEVWGPILPIMEWTAKIEGMKSASRFFGRAGAPVAAVSVIVDLSEGNFGQAAVNSAIIVAVPTAVMFGYPAVAGAIAVGGAVYGVVQVATGD